MQFGHMHMVKYSLPHRILPGLLSILTGLLFQHCGFLYLFQVQNVYEIVLRRRFLFFSFAYNIWLIPKSMENTSEILRMAQIAKVPPPSTLIPLLGNSQSVLPPLCICH